MSDEKQLHDLTNEQTNRKILWFILAGALILRWLHLLIASSSDLVRIPIIDSSFYHQWAVSISKGNLIGDTIFFMSPLYPYLTGLVYSILGVAPWKIMAIQGLLGVTTVYFVFKIGSRLVNSRVGLIAAGSAAIYSPFIFYDSTLLTSSIILLLSALILNYSLEILLPENKDTETDDKLEINPSVYWKLGVVIGLSALARPLVLIFMPFLIFAFFRSFGENWIKRSLHVIVAIAIILAPVGIRNLIIGEEFTLTTSSAGMNLYVGNNPEATGLYWEAPFLTSVEPWFEDEDYRRVASESVERSLTTREAGRYWMRKSMDWIINNPVDYLKLLGHKAFYFLNRTEFANNVSIYMGKDVSPLVKFNPFSFWIIGPLGFGGLFLIWRRFGWRHAQILWLWLAAYFVGALLFFVASEYRLPILLVLHIGAAYFIFELIERIKEKKIEPILNTLLAGLILLPLVNLRTDFIERGENSRMDQFNYGNTLLKQSNYPEAIKRFEKAIEIDPYFSEGLLKLAEVYYRTGQKEKATEIGQRVGLDNPETIFEIIKGSAMREAYALLQEGKFGDAMKEFSAAGMELEKATAETTRVSRLFGAQTAFEDGNREETLRLFQLINEADKEKDPSINYNIGFLHWQFGNIDSAEAYADIAMDLDSLNMPSAYLLARIYNATDRREEAESLMRKVNPDSEQAEALLDEVRSEMDSHLVAHEWLKALESYGRYGRLGYETAPEDKIRIGRAQHEVGNIEQALELFEAVEAMTPGDSRNLYYMGRSLIALKRVSEGIEVLRKTVAIDPHYVEPRIILSRQFFHQDMFQEAWQELNAVRNMDILEPTLKIEYTALLDSVKTKM